jgi:hypothetical protein
MMTRWRIYENSVVHPRPGGAIVGHSSWAGPMQFVVKDRTSLIQAAQIEQVILLVRRQQD